MRPEYLSEQLTLPIPTKDGGTLPIAVLKDAKLDVSKLADEGGALQ
jgi:hypothetical protein